MLLTSRATEEEKIMTQPTAIPVLPVEENVQHKTDNLEWAYLPTHACDLEFRIPLTVSLARDHVRVFVLAVGVSALAPLLAVNCRLWLADRLWNWPVLVATLAIAGLLAAGSQLRRTSRSTGEEPSFLSLAAILSLAMPAFAWLVSLAMTASVPAAGGRLPVPGPCGQPGCGVRRRSDRHARHLLADGQRAS